MKVFEIYESIQGETQYAGLPCTLVRFAGCDLRCGYCDTPQAFYGGQDYSIDQVVADVVARSPSLVLLTGGEPMLQSDIGELSHRLLARLYTVMIETSGAQDLSGLPEQVVKIVDIKTPGSGEADRMYWANLGRITPRDAVKFVLTSEEDYQYAKKVIAEHDLAERVQLLMSPAWGQVHPKDLVEWMLRDGVRARLNLQLHKYVWGAEAVGV